MKPVLKTLPNGLRALLIAQPTALTATALVLVATGSRFERKEENGLSHFLEHMCFKGTDTLPTAKIIAESFERIGAMPNAFTSVEYTGYFAKGGPKNISIYLDVLADIYLNSIFPEAEIQKEKGVIIEEINMYEDMPQQKVGETLMQLMYGDQPAGWTIAGSKENVTRFTRADLVRYKLAHYHAENTIVVVSGAIDEKVLMKQITHRFGSLSSARATKKKKVKIQKTGTKLAVVHRQIDQAHIAIGFHSVPYGHADRYALSLLATILGRGMSSRLSQVLREELGAAYYVGAGHDTQSDMGMFEISAGIDKQRINEIIVAIAHTLSDITKTLVPAGELEKAKEYTFGMQRIGLESSDDIAGFYASQLLMKGEWKSPSEIERLYRAVTVADIRRVARKIFKGANTALAVIGPCQAKDVDIAPLQAL